MSIVRVNVFTGTEPQAPQVFDVIATTYQDIITELIKYELDSGQIYTIDGNYVNYDDPIKMNEVNYIIPEGASMIIFIKSLLGTTYSVKYKKTGTVRDLYNGLIAQGVDKNIRFLYQDRILSLDEPIEPLNLSNIEKLHFVINRKM